jgi:nickel/cobalt transporter (NicO) family protein
VTLLAISAAAIGFIHSLAPGHWLPVVLMAKSRKWSLGRAVLGAFVAASGHIVVSVTLGLIAIFLGEAFLHEYGEIAEQFGGFLLVGFGVIYSALSYFRHAGCHGHEHHGPSVRGVKTPYLLLFSVGFAPCLAALPVFIAAAGHGTLVIISTIFAFCVGVLGALVGGTVLVSRGMMKLDHPLFEHHGDTLTGFVVALMGLAILMLPHSH